MRLKAVWSALAAAALVLGCGSTRGRDDDPDGGEPPECSETPTCGPQEVCLEGQCEPAYGLIYRVGLTSVHLSRSHDPDGSAWDEDGSPPDPYVCLRFGYGDDVEEHCTDPEEDSYDPWFGSFTVETLIGDRRALEVDVCDDDSPEPACWIVAELSQVPMTALRSETLTFFPDDPARQDDYAITLSFVPIGR